MIFKARAILFDMDGTLVDSNVVSDLVWSLWAEKNGISFQSILDVHHGRRPEETIELVAPHLLVTDHAPGIYEAHTKITEGLKLIEGSKDIFNILPLSSVAVVTSASRPVTITRFTAVGLRLDTVMVTSELVKKGKPDPEPFLLGASLLKVDPKDCLVFEDAPAGIKGAKAAGMKVIALATTHKREELSEADFIINDYTDLKFSICDSDITIELNDMK